MWHLPPSLALGPAALPLLPLALLVALLVWPLPAAAMARRLGLNPEQVSQAVTSIGVAGLLGSRLALFAAYPRDFLATPRALLTTGGPIARWGAVAGVVAACAWLLWKHRAEAWAWLDAAFAGAPIPLAVVAVGWSDPGAIPAALGLTVAGLVTLTARAPARPGQPALATVLLLAIVGFALPWFRLAAPDTVAVWPGWTWTQWALLAAGLAAGVGLWLREGSGGLDMYGGAGGAGGGSGPGASGSGGPAPGSGGPGPGAPGSGGSGPGAPGSGETASDTTGKPGAD